MALSFLDFLAFFLSKEFLAFLRVFPFFPKDFRGKVTIKNPCFFGGFPCRFPKKKQATEDSGYLHCQKRVVLANVPSFRLLRPRNIKIIDSRCPGSTAGRDFLEECSLQGHICQNRPLETTHPKNLLRLPVVQMALQTEKKYFRIIYAFHSRYRYRRNLFWN